MRALTLTRPAPITAAPLALVDIPRPEPGPGELLLKVSACGLCHADLHIIDGELPPHKLPLVPGHQVVGRVELVGPGVSRFQPGERVGVPWLYSTCGECKFCQGGRENLCPRARFTGYDVDGGYAQYTVVHQDFALPIPEAFADERAAPLLCAGIIGYRALRLAGAQPGERLGLHGFGASAHITLQVAVHLGAQAYVFSRSQEHRRLAEDLGAAWTGDAQAPPGEKLDAAIIFAPAGELAPVALDALDRGGRLVLAGIYMTPIPELAYERLYHERSIRSVANATRQDGAEFLKLAAEAPVRTEVQTFPLREANRALQLLKEGKVQGAGVLVIT
ncbi:MAG TPA: zinc-dependent alcohol dehydrogenase family protein [Dehalococcoidia bacterium]|nr:zinc-dependent alcohol dehydrogenase family protein [Dehalococcoidia bacterium]